MSDRAVCAALAMAASGVSPHKSVRVNSVSALTTTARPSLSCSNCPGCRTASVPFSGRSASSIKPKRRPGRPAPADGLVIDAEMALAGSARITGVVLVDACGIEVPGHPVADFFSLTVDQVAEFSYHDPGPFRIDPAAMSAGQRAVMAGNREALAVYGGTTMTDPGLRARLGRIAVPALVLWGDSDRIVDPDYGRAYAAAIPGAEFRLLPATGHVPQIETPDQLLGAIADFAAPRAAAGRSGPGGS